MILSLVLIVATSFCFVIKFICFFLIAVMVASAPLLLPIATASCRVAVMKLCDMPAAVSGLPVQLIWSLYGVAVRPVILMPIESCCRFAIKLAGAVRGLIRTRTSSLTCNACVFHVDGLGHNFDISPWCTGVL